MNKHYVDISQAPISTGDIVEWFDEANEEVYKLKALELQQETDTSRVFKMEVLHSTGNLEENSKHIITFPKNEEIKGYVYKQRTEEGTTKFRNAGLNIENIIVNELKEFLDSRVAKGYSAMWKTEVVPFFRMQGIGPIKDMGTDLEVSKYLRKIVSKRKTLFRSSGGHVSSLRPTDPLEAPGNRVAGTGIREVDFHKLTQALRMVLESGLFGKIKLIGK